MSNGISLGQVIVPVTASDPQRTFINCLPSIDLELWFQGTIFCEMEDLDKVPPKQTLLQSIVLVKRGVQGYFYLSKTTFESLKLKIKSFFHKDLFVSNS